MRQVTLENAYTIHAEGSVLITIGNTKVLCNASVSTNLPRFLQNSDHGWVTAEYGMLPRSTHDRMDREATRGKQSGRTMEIQRLIGRSLRAAVDLKQLKDVCITVDCDVIQADGGTRTAAITGGCVALRQAINHLLTTGKLKKDPFKHWISAISVGIVDGEPLLDLDYSQDSQADTDMNVVMNDAGGFIEIQGTAEKDPFDDTDLATMLKLAKQGTSELFALQKQAVIESTSA